MSDCVVCGGLHESEDCPRQGGDPLPSVWRQFHDAGFSVLWYAHPGPNGYWSERFGPRWHAGVDTGPQGDLICLKHCATNEEAERWLSPGGWTPEEAVRLALIKRDLLDKESP